jgi:predicted PurR-regulated permease PerM
MKENISLSPYDKKQKNYTIFIGVIFVLFMLCIIYLWNIVFPFILGFAITFVAEPLVRGMAKIRINRLWSAIILTLLVLVIILFLLFYVTPSIIIVITKLVKTISVNLQNNTVFSQSVIDWFSQHHINLNQDRILLSIQENFSRILNTIPSSALGILGSGVKMAETILIALLTFFYMLKEKTNMTNLLSTLIPLQKKNQVILLVSHSIFQIRQFIKSLVFVSFIILFL